MKANNNFNDSLIISEQDLGLRIDKLLAMHFPKHSRSYFQYLINEKCVLLNGLTVKKQQRAELGNEIKICFLLSADLDVKPEPIPLDILFEDEHILVVNKPPNMVVHPAPGAYSGTFANALVHHCKTLDTAQFDSLRPGIVHRLDKDTSGVLIAAKTLAAHQKLIEQFSKRQVEKRYLAICHGSPPQGEFSAPIKRHPVKRKQMTVSFDGKNATSIFKTLEKYASLTLVEVILVTGRTHQIRVHLSHLDCPILGDPVYGNMAQNRKYALSRQLLHAQTLKLSHPLSQTPLELKAPLPPDMKNFIDQIQQA